MSRVFCSAALALAVTLDASLGAQREKAPSIADLLATYQRGDFASAVKTGASLDDLDGWRKAYPTAARAWIEQVPQETARRRLVAAGLVLEVARERYERDSPSWNVLREVVEWACRELRRESSTSAGERAWQRASVALGQRVHDVFWLGDRTRQASTLNGAVHHLEHAIHRFPADPRFPLAQLVIESRRADLDIVGRENRRSIGPGMTPPPLPSFGAGQSSARIDPFVAAPPTGLGFTLPEPRTESRFAIASFTPHLRNPEVGADAETHVSHLYLMLHEWGQALEHARLVIELARDHRVRYLGFVLAGRALTELGRAEEARAAYGDALAAFPEGQSAALLLAALIDTVDRPDAVISLVRRSLAARPLLDDPWRPYTYGDYFHWSTYIEDLHEALR